MIEVWIECTDEKTSEVRSGAIYIPDDLLTGFDPDGRQDAAMAKVGAKFAELYQAVAPKRERTS